MDALLFSAGKGRGERNLAGLQKYLRDFAKSGYWLIPLLWAVAVVAYAPYFGVYYSPDSYYYALLGRNVVSGHGYMTSIIRENLPEANFYSRSYPPVMPLLCGMTDWLLHSGIASGLIVDLLALYGMLHVCYLIGMRFIPRLFYLLPAACFVSVFVVIPMVHELLAGRSIPVAAFLFLMLLWLVTDKEDMSRWRCIVTGTCLGAMYLTRFDVSLFCLALPPFLCWVRREDWKKSLFIYAGLLLAVSPWMVRNVLTFGSLLVSSNWVAVVSVVPSDKPTLMFFKDGVPSGLEQPALWLTQRAGSLVARIGEMVGSFVPYGAFAAVPGIIILCLNCLTLKKYNKNRAVYVFLCVSFLWIAVDLATVAVTLLPDARYFSIVALLGWLGVAISAGLIAEEKYKIAAVEAVRHRWAWNLLAGALIIGVVFSYLYPHILKDSKQEIFAEAYDAFRPFIEPEAMIACDGYADNFAYYTPWKMIYFPTNAATPADADFIAWKEHFHVRYLIVMDQSPFLHYSMKILSKSGPFVLIDLKG